MPPNSTRRDWSLAARSGSNGRGATGPAPPRPACASPQEQQRMEIADEDHHREYLVSGQYHDPDRRRLRRTRIQALLVRRRADPDRAAGSPDDLPRMRFPRHDLRRAVPVGPHRHRLSAGPRRYRGELGHQAIRAEDGRDGSGGYRRRCFQRRAWAKGPSPTTSSCRRQPGPQEAVLVSACEGMRSAWTKSWAAGLRRHDAVQAANGHVEAEPEPDCCQHASQACYDLLARRWSAFHGGRAFAFPQAALMCAACGRF